ncbi:hypothetical protein SAMN05421676_107120 [Salinibacillus kushneri]|uniref:Uncharacterized protein n=1 Tax=Salinibacillus kushneri TaxID=237682 RepID=A0A1I0GQW2_9BACI|nr:hypothetical protein SAMN05421676_107120 [Salinibacillus kushneri]
MSQNKEGSNYLLKKYWKAWVTISSILLCLFLLNEFLFHLKIVSYIVFIMIILLPFIFYGYVNIKEKNK